MDVAILFYTDRKGRPVMRTVENGGAPSYHVGALSIASFLLAWSALYMGEHLGRDPVDLLLDLQGRMRK